MRIIFFLLSLIVLDVCGGGYQIQHHTLLPLQASKKGPTRLSIRDEKIIDLFAYPDDQAKIVLHQSGSIFVVPESEGLGPKGQAEEGKVLYLSLLGEKGTSQDIKLRFVSKEVAPIVLYPTTKGENA